MDYLPVTGTYPYTRKKVAEISTQERWDFSPLVTIPPALWPEGPIEDSELQRLCRVHLCRQRGTHQAVVIHYGGNKTNTEGST